MFGAMHLFLWIEIVLITILGANSLSVGDIAVHKAPLQHNSPNSPYCYAVSNPSDLMMVDSPYNFLATQVWPSARVAAESLQKYMDPTWSVCEMGCGPGLPSLTAASLGSPRIWTTDLDPLALELVQRAAREQGWEDRVSTSIYNLVQPGKPTLFPPTTTDEDHVDLYILSDVFESAHVAKGAAHIVDQLLTQRPGCRVWVFAQTDRAQKDDFVSSLNEIRKQRGGATTSDLSWTLYQKGQGPKLDVVYHEQDGMASSRLWLCSMDETDVSYG